MRIAAIAPFGHKLGMGKEIQLMFCVAKAGLPSGSKLGTEVLRMHELQTCEIPLLWRSGSTVWSAAPPVCAMPPHLDGAAEKAGAASASDDSDLAAPRTGGRLHPFTTVLQAAGSGAAGVSVSISPGNAAVCFPKSKSREFGSSARRWLFPKTNSGCISLERARNSSARWTGRSGIRPKSPTLTPFSKD